MSAAAVHYLARLSFVISGRLFVEDMSDGYSSAEIYILFSVAGVARSEKAGK
jgi:hypothetical protein